MTPLFTWQYPPPEMQKLYGTIWTSLEFGKENDTWNSTQRNAKSSHNQEEETYSAQLHTTWAQPGTCKDCQVPGDHHDQRFPVEHPHRKHPLQGESDPGIPQKKRPDQLPSDQDSSISDPCSTPAGICSDSVGPTYPSQHQESRDRYLSQQIAQPDTHTSLRTKCPTWPRTISRMPSSARQRGNGICYQSTSLKPHRWSLSVTDSPRGLRMGRAARTPSTVEMPAPHCTEHCRYHCTLHLGMSTFRPLIACHPTYQQSLQPV